MFPKVLSDIHSSLGYKNVPYNKFMPEVLTIIEAKWTYIKNVYPDSIVSNTDKCDIKYTSTLTKHTPKTDKYYIKHTITPTQYALADPILSQSDIIHMHQQKKLKN